MRKFSRFIVNHKVIVMIVFIVITVVVAAFIPFVRVNYDDTAYLPKTSNVSQSLEEMYNSFGDGGNVTVMFKDISIAQTVRNKNKMMEVKSRRVVDGKIVKKETVAPIDQIIWIDSLILAREFNLWQLVDTTGKVNEDGKIKHPNTLEMIEPYTNVELVAYVWEMGKVLIPLTNDPTFKQEVADAGLGAFDVIQTKLNEKMMTEKFKQDVYESNPLEKKEFFNRLFAEDEKNPGENDFLNNVFPILQQTIIEMVLEGKIEIPQDLSAGEGSFDVSMISDQLAPFWKANTGQSIGAPTKNGNALLQVMFKYSDYDDATANAINQIKKLDIGAHIIGNAAVVSNSIEVLQSLTMKSMIFGLIVIVVILLLTTNSFWEPVLLLVTIGAAILLNMGTNILMWNGISYMTQGVASVLQLALTMDYSIYLLNRFKQEKQRGLTSNEAMVEAITNSVKTVFSASLTTVASFAALCFMSYKLGLDMGLVLIKGVLFSLIAVFVFMPTIILMTEKLIYKTAHKTLNFSFKKFSKFLIKTRYYLPILLIAIIIPSFIFQSQNQFTYGQEASLEGPQTEIRADKAAIREIFGEQNQVVVLLPEDAKFTSQKVKVSTLEDGSEVITLPEQAVEGAKSSVIISKENLLYQKLHDLKIENETGLPVSLGVQSFQNIADSGGAGIIPGDLKAQMVVVDKYDDRGIRAHSTDHIMVDQNGDIYVIENGRYRLKRTAQEDALAKKGAYNSNNNLGEKYANKDLYYEYKNISADGENPNYKYVLVKYDPGTKLYENVLDSNGNIQTKEIKATTYRRVIMFLPVPQEGEKTTKAIDDIDTTIANVYGDEAFQVNDGEKRVYTIGQSVATLEIKEVVNDDYGIISAISIGLVFLILLITYKSILLPLLMILVIQGSIYLNMVVPYMQGEQIVFVGYMMVSSILLGATIDYAIVLVSHYLEYRQKYNKYDSVQQALASSSRTLITSGGILMFAGLSTNLVNKAASPATAMFGSMIFRGGLASLLLVFIMMPQLLLIFDTPIRATMLKGKTKMIQNNLAKPLHEIGEKGKIDIERKSKKALTQKERERAIIDSLLRGIKDKDYDPDTFTFEDYVNKDSSDESKLLDAMPDTKTSKPIDMYTTLQSSLEKDASSSDIKDSTSLGDSSSGEEKSLSTQSDSLEYYTPDQEEVLSETYSNPPKSPNHFEVIEKKKILENVSFEPDILKSSEPSAKKDQTTSQLLDSKDSTNEKTQTTSQSIDFTKDSAIAKTETTTQSLDSKDSTNEKTQTTSQSIDSIKDSSTEEDQTIGKLMDSAKGKTKDGITEKDQSVSTKDGITEKDQSVSTKDGITEKDQSVSTKDGTKDSITGLYQLLESSAVATTEKTAKSTTSALEDETSGKEKDTKDTDIEGVSKSEKTDDKEKEIGTGYSEIYDIIARKKPTVKRKFGTSRVTKNTEKTSVKTKAKKVTKKPVAKKSTIKKPSKKNS